MFEAFVIMLREGVEAALVVGIILAVLRKSGRHQLERSVYTGVGVALAASLAAAFALHTLPINEEAYEGTLYLTSAAFVISMMWWMHRKARTLRGDIEQRVQQAVAATPGRGTREAWALGGFAFLMVFREGAETVLFLSAVNLTTDALLSFIGGLLGLVVAVVFAVLFVRGSLRVNLRRFFAVTEWVLAIFVLQLLVNGYHEFAEGGFLPATQASMAVVGPVVRNNSLFILAIVAIPLFIWLSRGKPALPRLDALAPAERRLAVARARRDRLYGYAAVGTTLLVLTTIGVVYARELMPRPLPAPEPVTRTGEVVVLPRAPLADGQLHRFGLAVGDRLVRFLVLQTADGKVRTALDACEICGSFGYVQEGSHVICLNCSAEINAETIGVSGGCNPIPLAAEVSADTVRVRASLLEQAAYRFPATGPTVATAVDPICGMRVNQSAAAAVETVNGTTYYFCSEHCHELFRKQKG